MKKSKNVILLIGLLIIAFTLLTFFLIDKFDKTTINYLALSFLLFAEIACFTILFLTLSKKGNYSLLYFRSAISVILPVYLLTVLILSFLTNRISNLNIYILIQIAVHLLFIIFITVFYNVSSKIHHSDSSLKEKMEFMQSCETKLHALLLNYTKHSAILNKLYENIKYADKVGTTNIDNEIYNNICELEQSLEDITDEGFIKITSTLNNLLNRRKLIIEQSKRGGF